MHNPFLMLWCRTIVSICLLMLCHATTYAQPVAEDSTGLLPLVTRLRLFGERIPQEKVFVHMDNTCYFLGDTIWFSAYTRQTNTDRPSKISRVLYAELWNHDGYLVERKIVEMKQGRGQGFFELYDTLYSGYYELRAYTRWQLNWGQTEHFHPWTLENRFYNKSMAKDFFRDYEKLYSRVFPVYDKPAEAGEFNRDMTFRPLRRYFKNAPREPELRLSLFPEGGNLVAGIPCRVAFEAATSEGEVKEGALSVVMKDETVGLFNERGEKVESVRTENRGRGTFTFVPEQGRSYEVVFRADDDSTKHGVVRQKIKAVRANGVSLRLNRENGQTMVDVNACGEPARQTLGMTVISEGRLQYFSPLDSISCHIILPDSILPTGVNQVTVFDEHGRIYADRLFFVTRQNGGSPTLTIRGIKDEYAPFEQVRIEVVREGALKGDSTGQAAVSLAVRDAVHSDNIFDSGNIMTEMLLASEIKGFVPQPEYFFEADDAEHRRALDLLMLTQGWRRFNWQEMAVKGAWEITHPAELTQVVTGTVNHLFLTDMKDLDKMANMEVLQDHFNMMDEHQLGYNMEGQSRVSWNLNPVFNARREAGALTSIEHGIYDDLNRQWSNNDYNVLAQSMAGYDDERRSRLFQGMRQYVQRGNLKKEVRVHAEFVKAFNQKASLIGDVETVKGKFTIELPRFYGECLFYLDASDTTKWKRKWEGFRRRKKRQWIRMQDWEFAKFPADPEFYVRLNFPYPRFIKPYTYYQVHNASAHDSAMIPGELLTEGTHLMKPVVVRAKHGGLRRIDFSKPAYVIDAYEATNMAMDAGKLMNFISWEYNDDETSDIAIQAAQTLVADMGMTRIGDYAIYYDTIKVFASYANRFRANFHNSSYPSPGERRQWRRLEYLDKLYIYTDYSPRREGDERYDQANQPSIDVRLTRFADGTRRVTYLNRRYILQGFAYPADFYHPDYQRHPPKEGQKDYRRTLYWNPDVQLDADGRAHISFFNNSQTTRICVEANGQAADGTLLYSGAKASP